LFYCIYKLEHGVAKKTSPHLGGEGE